ncbi:TadE/TadG family type IV pilus assembly protein [Streptomyces sp. NPDC002573]|uniref:TadE/TadG family type IV pilus assembly protein n=1 Tax=Streptomyces sp. NPDC002573 TaxID=3364651 RepID=UPI003688E4EC
MNKRVRARLTSGVAQMAARDDRGQVTVFVVCVFAALWLFAGIVVDGGLALAAKTQALDAAGEAARIGTQQLDIGQLRRANQVRLLREKAAAAARTYIASTGDTGTASVQGDAVTVHVTHHQRTQILQLIGLRTLSVHATGTAHAERPTP